MKYLPLLPGLVAAVTEHVHPFLSSGCRQVQQVIHGRVEKVGQTVGTQICGLSLVKIKLHIFLTHKYLYCFLAQNVIRIIREFRKVKIVREKNGFEFFLPTPPPLFMLP